MRTPVLHYLGEHPTHLLCSPARTTGLTITLRCRFGLKLKFAPLAFPQVISVVRIGNQSKVFASEPCAPKRGLRKVSDGRGPRGRAATGKGAAADGGKGATEGRGRRARRLREESAEEGEDEPPRTWLAAERRTCYGSYKPTAFALASHTVAAICGSDASVVGRLVFWPT